MVVLKYRLIIESWTLDRDGTYAWKGFFLKEDVVKILSEHNVKIFNLCHVPEDGRFRTLSFSAPSKSRVCEILDLGERVEGPSLFSFIDTGRAISM